MLSGSFYTLTSFAGDTPGDSAGRWHARLRLDPSHPVYAGHFPGNPVVPGVCQVQIIRELAEMAVKTPLLLRSSDNIKFLSMIVPQDCPMPEADLTVKSLPGGGFDVTATLHANGTTFLKFRGTFETFDPCRES